MSTEGRSVVIAQDAMRRLIAVVQARHPTKCFGYLVSDSDARRACDFVMFEGNARNDGAWKRAFESRGRYFVEHEDAGFVATPEEAWKVQREVWERGLFEVGVFHTHQRHPPNLSAVDHELHRQRFESLWHLIISMRNPLMPQMRAYAVTATGVRELAVEAGPRQL